MLAGLGDLGGAVGERGVAGGGRIRRIALSGHAAVAGREPPFARALRGGLLRALRRALWRALRDRHASGQTQHRGGGSGEHQTGHGTHLGATITEP